jgi:hypothetical protein
VELGPGSPALNSHAGSLVPNGTFGDGDGGGDSDYDDDSNEEDIDGDPLRTPAAISAVPSATSTPYGQKCKSMADSIAEISACERDNHIKIAKINASAKTEHSTQWETIKRQMNMDLELACMQHQQDEAAAQCAHEAAMFDRQATLKMARADQGQYGVGGPHDNIHPNLC